MKVSNLTKEYSALLLSLSPVFSCFAFYFNHYSYVLFLKVLLFNLECLPMLMMVVMCTVGFNAPVAGTFFAIETVLRPQHAENSPPLTTAMIILAAVISSTVSQVLLGERPAFTVPPYELRSAAGTEKNSF